MAGPKPEVAKDATSAKGATISRLDAGLQPGRPGNTWLAAHGSEPKSLGVLGVLGALGVSPRPSDLRAVVEPAFTSRPARTTARAPRLVCGARQMLVIGPAP